MARVMGIGMLAAAAFFFLAPVRAADVGDFPKGTFAATRGRNDWTISFDGKGKFTATLNRKAVVEGTYKVAKDEIELTDEKGPYAAKGEKKSGKYQWKVEDKKLTFKKVEDKNADREKVLGGGAWSMK